MLGYLNQDKSLTVTQIQKMKSKDLNCMIEDFVPKEANTSRYSAMVKHVAGLVLEHRNADK